MLPVESLFPIPGTDSSLRYFGTNFYYCFQPDSSYDIFSPKMHLFISLSKTPYPCSSKVSSSSYTLLSCVSFLTRFSPLISCFLLLLAVLFTSYLSGTLFDRSLKSLDFSGVSVFFFIPTLELFLLTTSSFFSLLD